MCGKEQKGPTSPPTLGFQSRAMQLENYFFFNPVFIIVVLVLVVIIIIIISWYLQRRKSNKEDLEKQLKRNDLSEKNLEVMENLLSSIGEEEIGRTATFGPTTELGFDSAQPTIMVSNEKGGVTDKIMTIMPDKAFRDFPKTEAEQMKMRRKNMLHMLSLPPL